MTQALNDKGQNVFWPAGGSLVRRTESFRQPCGYEHT